MPIIHQGIFYFISILILLVGKNVSPYIYLLQIPYILFLLQRIKWKSTVCVLLGSGLFVMFMRYPGTIDDLIIEGAVWKTGDNYVVVKVDDAKVKVYGEFEGYSIKDKVKLEVTYFPISKPTNDNAFDYEKYLKGQGILQQAYCTGILEHQKSRGFHTLLQDRFKEDTLVNSFASLFILGVKEKQIEDYYQQMTGISLIHLFALSGMHIHLLMKWLKSFLQYILPPTIVEWFCYGLIGFYLVNIPFNISFIRAYLMMVGYAVMKRWFNQIDVYSIVACVTLFLNPYLIFNLSFVFSYFIYLMVLLVPKTKYSNLIVYASCIPIVLSIQYQLPVFSFLLSFVFTPLIEVLYACILWYGILGGLIEPLIQLLIKVFELFLSFSSDFSWVVGFCKPPLLFYFVYYYYLGCVMKKATSNRRFFLEGTKVVTILFVFYLYANYSLHTKVVMLDIGQGDSFLLVESFGRGAVLIDTGGNKDFDLATKTTIPYLRSIGVHELDYVFISHDDFDHMGALESLVQNFPVKQLVRDTRIKDFTIGDIDIELLDVGKISDDRNDQSLIMDVSIHDDHYLFVGDASVAVEKEMMRRYPQLQVDVLKIGHHGSSTSTCTAFLQQLNPYVALISVGKDNDYGHPTKEVIERINDLGISVYRTDQDGMVSIIYYGKDGYIYQ